MKFDRSKKVSLVDIADAMSKKPEDTAESEIDVAEKFKEDFCTFLETGYSRLTDVRSPGRHASQLWKTCPRKTALMAVEGLKEAPEVPAAGSFMTQDEGHALHEWWQDRYLAEWGVLKGLWRCVRCGRLNGATKDRPIPKPDVCEYKDCVSNREPDPVSARFEYVEERIKIPGLNVVGSVDAILDYRKEDYVGEVKTKSVSQFRGVHQPQFPHLVQVHGYMAGTGIRQALIIYLQKGKMATWGRPGGVWTCKGATLKVFKVDFDDALWTRVKQLIVADDETLRQIEAGDVTTHADVERFERACNSPSCELAKECPVSKTCFELRPPLEV